MDAIHCENLKKSYGANLVLDGVNLKVAEGEFYALMGPNGSGKTTLSSIIASVTSFDGGSLEIFGQKPERARRMISYIPQDSFSVPQLTGKENLIYFAGLLGYSGAFARSMVEEMLRKVGLWAEGDKRVAHYSGGMRKRLEVATALFPDIRLLILDEPTTGLDPSARREFFSLVQGILNHQTSIFLITHLGTDAEMSSRVGLMEKGRIIAEDTPEGLRTSYAGDDVITVETAIRNQKTEDLLKGYSSQKIAETPSGYRIFTRNGDQVVSDVSRTLSQAGNRVTRTEVTKPTLEDVFFKLTEQSMPEAGEK
jgi:ABC-2 type transport system ATP-binding protein